MPAEKFAKITFYIVAHADDWQLFMYPNVYNDLIALESKAVFIITTAGDAGSGETYWRAREEGAKSSVRFCFAPFENIEQSSSVKNFNGHMIHYWNANNAAFYFLRLPDGNLNGEGFTANHFQSLLKLKTEEINTITAIDNSTTYNGWFDFYITLRTIILAESHSISNKWINYLNPDKIINPNDHADHVATGEAVQCMNIITNFQQTLFTGYNVSSSANKLKADDIFLKTCMFAAYEKAVFDNSNYSTLKEGINIYLGWCLCSAVYSVINAEV